MALTFTKVRHDVTTAGRLHVYDVTFDNSYQANGEPVTAANFGLRGSIQAVYPSFNGATAANNRIITWDSTNGVLHVWTALGTEATGASDQSAVTARCIVYGDNVSGR
jgi:hypothetical protein